MHTVRSLSIHRLQLGPRNVPENERIKNGDIVYKANTPLQQVLNLVQQI